MSISNNIATPSRIVIYAESGLLAGDLAALLSASFAVQRVTNSEGARRALKKPQECPDALVLVQGPGVYTDEALILLIDDYLKTGSRVIILGASEVLCPPRWQGRVQHLDNFPKPRALLRALGDIHPLAVKEEG